jgi:regulator of sigma E protease
MEILSGWVGLLLGFSGLIFIHELGHFALAKWNGVRVYVFSLGMGPYLVSFSWRGTVYALSLIPIGGYVKLQGQDDLNPNETASADESDYRNKRPGQRAAILAAGAAFNLIFTVFIFSVCYMWGMPIEPARIGNIDPDKPLAKAVKQTDSTQEVKLQEGDTILEVNGVPVRTFLDANLQIAGSSRSKPLGLRVKRSNGEIEWVHVQPVHDTKNSASSIGMTPYDEKLRLPLGFVTQDVMIVAADPKDIKGAEPSPAAEAGLRLGDEIVSLEFHDDPLKAPVKFKTEPGDLAALDLPRDIRRLILKSEGRPMILTVNRDGEELKLKLSAKKGKEADAPYMIGAQFGLKRRVSRIAPECEAYQAGLRENYYVYLFQPDDNDIWNETTQRYVVQSGTLTWSTEWTHDEKAHTKTAVKVPVSEPKDRVFYQSRLLREKFGPLGAGDALSNAWGDTLRYSASVFTVLKGLFTGTVGASALSGPAGIGTVMYKVASNQSFIKYLWFLGFISLNLGVLQFVPIPLLDGWHLLMILIEKVKGSPVQPKIQEAFQYVGLFLIGGLLLMATFNDITRNFFN